MISVIVPVYNGEKTIGRCLSSLLNQTYGEPYEIIVVDDGSTDNTIEVVKQYRNVKFIAQTHKGPAAARNLGAKNANGSIVLFTDSDCIPDRNWLTEMIKPFERDGVVGVQGIYKTNQRGVVARFVQLEIEDRYDKMRGERYIDFIGSYAAAYKKDVFLAVGGFNESFLAASGEDTELSYRLASSGHKMVFNPFAIVYHTHPSTTRKYLNQKFYRAYWRVLLYRKHRHKMMKDTYTPQILKLQMILIYLLGFSIIYSFFFYSDFSPAIAVILIFLLTTAELSVKNSRNDRIVGIITPPMVFLRACALSSGFIWGIFNLSRRRA